jgi:hypothetical protein
MNGNGILFVLQVGAAVTNCGKISEILLSRHHGRTRRLQPRIYPYATVADLLQPVQPEIAQSRSRRVLGQVISRATREQRDRGKPGSEMTEQFNRSGQRSCLVRIIDNRCEGAVEIKTYSSRLRLRCQPGARSVRIASALGVTA